MIEVIVLFILGILWVGFASLQDLKEREVADWLNFSLIIFALGFRFFYSLFSNEGFWFFYSGLIGLAIFFVIGNLLYYSRFFAGGDAKMFIAFGTLIPFSSEFNTNINYISIFLFLFLFVGAIYGLLNSMYYSYKNWSACKREFKKQFDKNKKIILLMALIGILFLLLGFASVIFVYVALMFFVFPYLYVFAKSIDEACMIKNISKYALREGDWLYKDVKIKGKIIEAKWEGLTKKEIALIKKSKLNKIKIRVGLAFIPVFLISFIIFSYLYFTELIGRFFIF